MGTFLKAVRKNLFGMITLVVSAGVLLFFLLTSNSLESLQKISQSIQYPWLIFAVAAAAAAWVLEGFVLNLLCAAVYPQWKFRYSFCVGMVGVLYSALTPFSTGGQPMQIYSMHRLGMDTGAAGSIIAVKTLVYQIVLVLYSFVMVAWMLPYFQTNVSGFSILTVFGLLCNSTFIFLVLLFCISQRLTDKILRGAIGIFSRLHLCRHPAERYRKIRAELSVFHGSSALLGRSPGLYAGACFFTLIQIACTCTIPYFIYRSFGFYEQPLNIMVAAQAYVSMVSAFVPLPGASGGAEGSFVLFFGPFFQQEAILPATVVWRVLTYYLNFPIGGICCYITGRLPALELSSTVKKRYSKKKS